MKPRIYIFFLGTLFLTSCSPSPEALATQPAAVWTPTPQPTYTPQPLILENFTSEIEGVGEHGNMACITYQGNKHDLEGLTITADISQGINVLDANVSLVSINEKDCFEMVDAKYKLGIPVDIEINVTVANGIAIENCKQTSEIGIFDWNPFLRWIFGDSPLNTKSNRLGFPCVNHPNAYDLQPLNANFPDGLNHPVYSPCDGKITLYEYVNLGGNNQFHNLFLYCEDTGYVIQLGHMESILQDGRYVLGDQSISIKAGDEIGKLVMEPRIGYPHNHTTLLRPLDLNSLNDRCLGGMINDQSCSEVVDFFDPTLTTRIGSSPIYGLWLSQFLPESTKKFIESGAIMPKY